jgi:hypothetical protein
VREAESLDERKRTVLQDDGMECLKICKEEEHGKLVSERHPTL